LPALPRCVFAVCWSTSHGYRIFVHFIDRRAVQTVLMWADLWKRIGVRTASL
jgi:hypothetical protein